MAVNRFEIDPETLSPLVMVDEKIIKSEIIDPTTGKPYNGIILEGIAASIDVVNRNNRKYDEENYVSQLNELRKIIHSPKGLYGELEHPEGYAINYNNVCCKILDVWYDKNLKVVFVRIMLLNTPKGMIAQEIVKSGGLLSVSARAAGYEDKQPDGVIKSLISLLVTYDVVYHPGFGNANIDFVKMNESLMRIENAFRRGENIPKIKPLIVNLNESYNMASNSLFNSEVGMSESYHSYMQKINMYIERLQNLNENDLTPEQQQKLENSQSSSEDNDQQQLASATEEELNEEYLLNSVPQYLKDRRELTKQKNSFFNRIQENINTEKEKHQKLGSALYDGEVGFLKSNGEGNLPNTISDIDGYVPAQQVSTE